jgi:hypothetical protein
VGRVRPGQQLGIVGHIEHEVEQAVAHFGLHAAPLVGGLREPKLALAHGVAFAAHYQLCIKR